MNGLVVIVISAMLVGFTIYMYESVIFRTEVKNVKRKKTKGVYKQNKVKANWTVTL
jgi:uncharacterized membrane-anchored protein